MEYHQFKLCGLKRQLPIKHISKKTKLANFTMLGDVELVDKIADNFASKLKADPLDFIIGSELKTIPLIHGVAKRLNHKRFVVCRKSVQPYMVSPIILKPLPYFPKHVKQLVLDGRDADVLKNKKVAIIDTVVSTGVTLRMMNKILSQLGAQIIKTLIVIKQGKQFDTNLDFSYLGELPIFLKTTT